MGVVFWARTFVFFCEGGFSEQMKCRGKANLLLCKKGEENTCVRFC